MKYFSSKKIVGTMVVISLLMPLFFGLTKTAHAQSQAVGAYGGTRNSERGENNIGRVGTDAAQCAVGDLLASSIKNYSVNALSGFLGGITSSSVPTRDIPNERKEVGISILGVNTVSWDAIGFCLVNAMVAYISESTIQWINNGFNGNPTFVENPGQFFSDIADIEAGAFINELSGGYLCSNIGPMVQISLINQQSRDTYRNRNTCTLNEVTSNFDNFVNNFEDGGWIAWEEALLPQNRADYALLDAQVELDRRISNRQFLLSEELGWSDGFLPWKDENGDTQTPGKIIQTEIEDTLNLKRDRLNVADEFDEVVTALINQLIKTALNETLQNR